MSKFNNEKGIIPSKITYERQSGIQIPKIRTNFWSITMVIDKSIISKTNRSGDVRHYIQNSSRLNFQFSNFMINIGTVFAFNIISCFVLGGRCSTGVLVYYVDWVFELETLDYFKFYNLDILLSACIHLNTRCSYKREYLWLYFILHWVYLFEAYLIIKRLRILGT